MSHLTKLVFESIKDPLAKDKLEWLKRDVKLLVVDEIEKDYKISDGQSFSGVNISDIFDEFYETKKCLIVTSNVPKEELDKVHSKNVVDRLRELVDIPLVGESYRGTVDKRAIILEGMR
jgi:DNA replication protein DnaC